MELLHQTNLKPEVLPEVFDTQMLMLIRKIHKATDGDPALSKHLLLHSLSFSIIPHRKALLATKLCS